jgi:hypothetical protein
MDTRTTPDPLLSGGAAVGQLGFIRCFVGVHTIAHRRSEGLKKGGISSHFVFLSHLYVGD